MEAIARALRNVGLGVVWMIAGCGGAAEEFTPVLEGEPLHGMIKFESMFSAWDGVHEYQVTPSIPLAAPDVTLPDAIDPESVRWYADDKFVSKTTYSPLPAGLLLTTKRAGTTSLSATAITLMGKKVKDTVMLQITAAKPGEWEEGERRYNNMVMFEIFSNITVSNQNAACPEFPVSIGFPKDSSCSNCHSMSSLIAVEHTPQQTGGYSDDELISIFTEGQKPAWGAYESPWLVGLQDPLLKSCIYKSFHTWEMPEEAKRGLVFKLRSLQPKPQEGIDYMRLAAASQAAADAANSGMP